MKTTGVSALGKAEEALSEGVQKLLAIAEAYPDLKANENFLALQRQLVETEDYLQFARRYYNGSVREFNTRIETVPNNIIAGCDRSGDHDHPFLILAHDLNRTLLARGANQSLGQDALAVG
jgi:LemA protein